MAFLDETGLAELWSITKEWGLKNNTKTLYGLGTAATPNDAFTKVWNAAARKGVHYWQKYTPAFSSETEVYIGHGTGFSARCNLSYSDSITLNGSTIELVNPKTVTITSDNYSSFVDTLKGKFFSVPAKVGSKDQIGIWYTASVTFSGGGTSDSYYLSIRYGKKVTALTNAGQVESNSLSGYVSGFDGTNIYEYLGTALSTVKFATGNYAGTGAYGSGSPVSLTFNFVPKIVFVWGSANGSQGIFVPAGLTGNFALYGYASVTNDTLSTSGRYAKISGKTLSWYQSSNALQQMNSSNTVYTYVAIG